jgi:hypothetical protein
LSERPPVVIALDYPGPGAARRIKNLGVEESAATVRYLFDEIRPRSIDIIGYAEDLRSRCAGEATTVDLILAYCGAATIARQLGRLLRADGGSPVICCINPETPPHDEAGALIRGFFAAVNAPPGQADRLLRSDDPGGLTPELLARAEDALVGLYSDGLTADVGPAGARAMAAELVASQINWACHIAAAGDPRRPAADAAEVHLTSADHRCDDGCGATHRVVGVDVDDLFRRLRPGLHPDDLIRGSG